MTSTSSPSRRRSKPTWRRYARRWISCATTSDHQGLACAADARRASQLLGPDGQRATVLSGIRLANGNHVRPPEEEDQAQREASLLRRAVEKFQGVEVVVLQPASASSPRRHLRTEASKFAVGGVLFQVVDGVERPIAHTSRKMKSAEFNYPTQQQELLAIDHALASVPNLLFGQATDRGDRPQESRRPVHAEDGEP
ncbi:hypothetical protein ON010_g4311 [Phytophthora cinnamomi]|nr:hypothetical protein ON010_g4311 [Phytophthora cinnamomi]